MMVAVMRQRIKRRLWPLLVGAISGYIAWDIVDQTVLQPRAPLWGGYLLDWGVAGLVGLSTLWLVERRRSHTPAVIHAAGTTQHVNPVVLEQIAASVDSLDSVLKDIHAAIGVALEAEGLVQHRQLRQAMVDVHHAASLSDEIAGLVAMPRSAAPPPPEQLAINNG